MQIGACLDCFGGFVGKDPSPGVLDRERGAGLQRPALGLSWAASFCITIPYRTNKIFSLDSSQGDAVTMRAKSNREGSLLKVALVQMNSRSDKTANIATARKLVAEAAQDGAELVVLPEYWAMLGDSPEEFHSSGEVFPEGEAYNAMQEMARRHKITLHGGSIVERDGNSHFNSTVVFAPGGEEIARYRKIHLFDVDVPGGVTFRESETIVAGSEVVTYKCNGLTIGCTICYDLRFPELFRALRDQEVDVIVLPAAFTLLTGKDHWEILLRARAIETQTHVLASGQFGTHADGGKACYGHSMAIDPWGHVVSQVGDHEGVALARIDTSYQKTVRANVPVHQHHVLSARYV